MFLCCFGAGLVRGEDGRIAFLVSSADFPLVWSAADGLRLPKGIDVAVFSAEDLAEPGPAREFVASARVLVVDAMVRELTDRVPPGPGDRRPRIYAVRSSTDDDSLRRRGFLFEDTYRAYYDCPSIGNLRSLMARVASEEFHVSIPFEAAVPCAPMGIYHPDAKEPFQAIDAFLEWDEQRSGGRQHVGRVGVLLFSSSLDERQADAFAGIIRAIEAAGLNVLPAFGPEADVISRFFLGPDRLPRVDLVLAFSLKFRAALTRELDVVLRELNVPVINALSLYYQTVEEWQADPSGLLPMEVAWAVATPELSGLIEPSILAGRTKLAGAAPAAPLSHQAVVASVERLLPRLKKWIELRRKPNRDKRVAILFYNHSQGKQNIGASYLNLAASIDQILRRMQAEGYRVDAPQALDPAAIQQMFLRQARNVGTWAPGELEELLKGGTAIRVGIETYRKWFADLPASFRDNVLKQWGDPADAKIMARDGALIIPAIVLGNVVLLPEPVRGLSDDPVKLYHSPTIYPHHQYIAAYLWLRQECRADAMVHLGTHATHEWLPGKQAGLSSDCSPEVLLTDIPNLYPYIVDNVGEGVQAKRRGRGVVIDHLTPPIREAGLYREYASLSDLLGSYAQARDTGSETQSVLLDDVRTVIRKTGIDRDLQLGELSADALKKVEEYLLEVKASFMPYGLHTLGVSPSAEVLTDMVQSIVRGNERLDSQEVRRLLTESGPNELNSLIRGLSGGYIPAGEGNDPIRNPRALPTGRNFHGFDPLRIPSAAAFQLGRKAAEDLVQRDLAEKGAVPEKVAVVLWATETFRNGGISESTVLSLLGVSPVWDHSGRVTGMEVIPRSVLQRPRIDVLISPSGLYRDVFPNLLACLDEAVRQAAAQDDVDNLIRRHTDDIRIRLLAQGLPEESANRWSQFRIFSEAPGSYGTGVAEMASASGIWESDDEVAGVYETRVGFAFGQGRWGEPARDALRVHLEQVDTAVHSMSSNLYGTMDNDDLFQHLGGLSLAVRKRRGRAPETLIASARDPEQVAIEPLGRTLGREFRARYLNPRWIEGMVREGYAGAREMSHFAEYLWGWQVTVPGTVDQAKWQEAYEVYVEDKYGLDVKGFLNRENPWAYQAMAAWMLEATRKEYWKPDEKVREKLAVEYASSVVEKGTSCCCHACRNPLLNQMVSLILCRPGTMGAQRYELSEKFQRTAKEATWASFGEQAEARQKLRQKLAGGFGLDAALTGAMAPRSQDGITDRVALGGKKTVPVTGYRMDVVGGGGSAKAPLPDEEIPWALLGVPLAILLLFLAGMIWATRTNREH